MNCEVMGSGLRALARTRGRYSGGTLTVGTGLYRLHGEPVSVLYADCAIRWSCNRGGDGCWVGHTS